MRLLCVTKITYPSIIRETLGQNLSCLCEILRHVGTSYYALKIVHDNTCTHTQMHSESECSPCASSKLSSGQIVCYRYCTGKVPISCCRHYTASECHSAKLKSDFLLVKRNK